MDKIGTDMVAFGHAVSLAALLGSIAGLLPAVASVLAIGWYLIAIYESKTMKSWREARRTVKLAALKGKTKALEAKITTSARVEVLKGDGEVG